MSRCNVDVCLKSLIAFDVLSLIRYGGDFIFCRTYLTIYVAILYTVCSDGDRMVECKSEWVIHSALCYISGMGCSGHILDRQPNNRACQLRTKGGMKIWLSPCGGGRLAWELDLGIESLNLHGNESLGLELEMEIGEWGLGVELGIKIGSGDWEWTLGKKYGDKGSLVLVII